MHRPLAGSAAGLALALTLVACSGDDDATSGASGDSATTSTIDIFGDSGNGDSGGSTADLPGDPCAVTKTALQSLGWTVGEAEVVEGPGGPHSQCTWSGEDTEGSFRNGWVMFIPGSQIDLEYHEDKAIDGIGEEAFQGSPQTGEVLVTGAKPPFRSFVTGGGDNDADVVSIAKAVIAAA